MKTINLTDKQQHILYVGLNLLGENKFIRKILKYNKMEIEELKEKVKPSSYNEFENGVSLFND